MTKSYKIEAFVADIFIHYDDSSGYIYITNHPTNKKVNPTLRYDLRPDENAVYKLFLEKEEYCWDGCKCISVKEIEQAAPNWDYMRNITHVLRGRLTEIGFNVKRKTEHPPVYSNKKGFYIFQTLKRCDGDGEFIADDNSKKKKSDCAAVISAIKESSSNIQTRFDEATAKADETNARMEEFKEMLDFIKNHVSSLVAESNRHVPENIKKFTGKLTTPVDYENGTTYIGDCKDGMPHGHGTMTWESEEREDGWVTDEEVYIGDFQNDKKHGKGCLYVHSYNKESKKVVEYRYNGEFKDDLQHGIGAEMIPEGILTGHWENGDMVGHYVIYFYDGSIAEGIIEKADSDPITEIIKSNDGGILIQRPDGSVEIYKSDDGDVALKRPDGSTEIIKWADGDVALKRPDGSTEIYKSDDGGIRIERPDGSVGIYKSVDGGIMIERPDGSTEIIKWADGDVALKRPDGSTEIYKSDDGGVILKRPDESVEIVKYPGGQVQLHRPDGSIEFAKFPDGTMQIERPDGSTVIVTASEGTIPSKSSDLSANVRKIPGGVLLLIRPDNTLEIMKHPTKGIMLYRNDGIAEMIKRADGSIEYFDHDEKLKGLTYLKESDTTSSEEDA